jgi:hypothetical protein
VESAVDHGYVHTNFSETKPELVDYEGVAAARMSGAKVYVQCFAHIEIPHLRGT